MLFDPLADQHKRALEVKETTRVLVCLGNPPYDRHEAADPNDAASRARSGSWVRWGEQGDSSGAILKFFLERDITVGHGVDLKNLFNLYVYFWRWALCNVMEHTTANGPGIVSFISASSYLDGDAFVGMREHIRKLCDEVWIIDLGGEGRGTRKSENIFAIQTPVAIAIAFCKQEPNWDTAAHVHYTKVEGTREEKLSKLEQTRNFNDFVWQDCLNEWQAPFKPAGIGEYFTWPKLTDLMPWQHSGVQLKRTWPIAPDKETLKRRWRALLTAPDRGEAFRETGDRTVDGMYRTLLTADVSSTPIAKLPGNAPVPKIERYAYRSFDRQSIIADGRLMSRPRPPLWRVHNRQQVYITSLFTQPLSLGPALNACAYIPDLDYFRGSYGAKAVMPLYRDAEALYHNFTPGLIELLVNEYSRNVTPEELLAYIYGVLAQPAFTERFHTELAKRMLCVPMTKNKDLFEKIVVKGQYLLWLHTYGERFTGTERPRGRVPRGKARCVQGVADKPDMYPESFSYDPSTKQLLVGTSFFEPVGTGVFEPVEPSVWDFEVSGLKVVRSWLGYRMREGKGRKSSPLDIIRPELWTAQFTTELLELLWVLEATLAAYPEQAQLLDAVLKGPLFTAPDLPDVPDHARKPPRQEEIKLINNV